MGWDVTYHPIKHSDIADIYFCGLENPDLTARLQERFGVDPFYWGHIEDLFNLARNCDPNISFENGHAFYLAILSGHLHRYHYIRGAALSFLIHDPLIEGYFADWRTLVPPRWSRAAAGNHLTGNYGGGVYVGHDQLIRLRGDYQSSPEIRARLDDIFSGGRLEVFWKAVDEAIAMGCGLLEATEVTEVTEPDPIDLNSSTSQSNLLNCQPDGPVLYARTVQAQLATAASAANSPGQEDPPSPDGVRRSWWSSLFSRSKR